VRAGPGKLTKSFHERGSLVAKIAWIGMSPGVNTCLICMLTIYEPRGSAVIPHLKTDIRTDKLDWPIRFLGIGLPKPSIGLRLSPALRSGYKDVGR